MDTLGATAHLLVLPALALVALLVGVRIALAVLRALLGLLAALLRVLALGVVLVGGAHLLGALHVSARLSCTAAQVHLAVTYPDTGVPYTPQAFSVSLPGAVLC